MTEQNTPKQNKNGKPGQNGSNQKPQKFEFRFNLNQVLNRGLLVFFFFLLFLPFLFSVLSSGQQNKISLSDLITDIRNQKVQKVEVAGSDIKATYKDSSIKTTRKEDTQDFIGILNKSNIDPTAVNVEVKNLSLLDIGLQLFANILPVIVMGAIFFLVILQA